MKNKVVNSFVSITYIKNYFCFLQVFFPKIAYNGQKLNSPVMMSTNATTNKMINRVGDFIWSK